MKKSSNALGLLALLLLVLWGCQSRPGVHDAGPSPSSPGTDAGPRRSLELQLEARLADGGVARTPLDASAVAVVPVAQSLNVIGNLTLRNYRLRILDELDRALASDDLPEDAPGLHYHIALLAPLRAGHRYTVLLDAQSGATLDTSEGVALPEQRFEFRTEGEREKDAPPKGPAKRRHHRTSGL
jgi:hypothetical protein